MNKYTSLILILCLLITCLVGCGEEVVTPTDTTNKTKTIQTEEETKKEDKTETPATEVAQPAENKQADKTKIEQESAINKQTDTTAKSTQENNKTQSLYTDMSVERPTFPSVANLQTWLLQGDEKFKEERAEVLSQTKTSNTIVYYKPTAGVLQVATLKYVEVNSAAAVNDFVYLFNDSPENDPEYLTFSVFSQNSKSDKSGYVIFKQDCMNKVDNHYSLVKDGVTYYYCKYTNQYDLGASVYWEQFGAIHLVNIDGHVDQIEEIIPLLKLEKVTLKTDAVTQ